MDSVLHKGNWLHLMQRSGEGYKYEYVHESRCGGNIIAILPVHQKKGMLVRQEFTPCWSEEGLHISSITGGWEKARHPTPIDTVVEELREEAGIVLRDESVIKTLGSCRGTKSSDTLYHLFLVDLSDDNYDEVKITTDGSVLEGKAHNEWMPSGVGGGPELEGIDKSPWVWFGEDPMLYVMYTRWAMGLFVEITRQSYMQ